MPFPLCPQILIEIVSQVFQNVYSIIGLENVNLVQKELVHFLTICSECFVSGLSRVLTSQSWEVGWEVGHHFQLRMFQGHLFPLPTSWQMGCRSRTLVWESDALGWRWNFEKVSQRQAKNSKSISGGRRAVRWPHLRASSAAEYLPMGMGPYNERTLWYAWLCFPLSAFHSICQTLFSSFDHIRYELLDSFILNHFIA